MPNKVRRKHQGKRVPTGNCSTERFVRQVDLQPSSAQARESTSQRLRSMTGQGRTHAIQQEAVIGQSDSPDPTGRDTRTDGSPEVSSMLSTRQR
jgi:hypothetical protein